VEALSARRSDRVVPSTVAEEIVTSESIPFQTRSRLIKLTQQASPLELLPQLTQLW
jgi:hypothetical protein